MKPLTYFANAHEAEPGAWLVQFFDLPEAITQGDTQEEAMANASDALSAAIEGYLERELALPNAAEVDPCSAAAGYVIFEVPVEPRLAAVALLQGELRKQGLSKSGLARRMGKDEKVVRRILSGENASLELALSALHAVGIWPALAA